MTPEEVRRILREELSMLIRSDRYVFLKLLELADGRDIQIGTGTGTKIGTATGQKIGVWNTTPIVQPTTAVAGASYNSVVGTALTNNDTFDSYTIAQVVKALRNIGLLA